MDSNTGEFHATGDGLVLRRGGANIQKIHQPASVSATLTASVLPTDVLARSCTTARSERYTRHLQLDMLLLLLQHDAVICY